MPRFAAWAVVLLAFGAMLPFGPGRAHADQTALWRIVHNSCVPQAEARKDAPLPCDRVDLADGTDRGVAFLKDRVGPGQMLAIATRRVSGIEDPYLLQDLAPNYFAAAWQAGGPLLAKHLGSDVPREDLALAINAAGRRSQDQFHIHIDCLDPQIAKALGAQAATLDEMWRPLSSPLGGRIYQARRVDGVQLTIDPFRSLADGIPAARGHMGDWSLAVVGATFAGQPGFVLLADSTGWLGSGGHAEDLQDHTCAAIRRP